MMGEKLLFSIRNLFYSLFITFNDIFVTPCMAHLGSVAASFRKIDTVLMAKFEHNSSDLAAN